MGMELRTDETAERGIYVFDDAGRIRVQRGGANAAALLRIGLGFLYLWAFLEQGLGVGYTNTHTGHPLT
jgi:thiosulfate dehydrogenase [quinone] large subunit